MQFVTARGIPIAFKLLAHFVMASYTISAHVKNVYDITSSGVIQFLFSP